MKACPICQSTYEDWIEFCFNDGVPLVAYEPKPPPARPSAPRPAAAPAPMSSSYDAPEARLVSGADLPEPAHLSRFSTPAPVVPAAPPAVQPAPPIPEPVAAPVELAPPTPIAAPLPEQPAPVQEEPTIPLAAAPPAPPVVVAPPVVAPAPPDPTPTADPTPAPRVSASATLVPSQREDHSPPTPTPPDFDADAMNDIASALQAPAPSGAPPVTFHPPLREESEDAKATVPMYTAYPDQAPPGRSALDDEPARTTVAGAGIGVALLGMLALGAFLVVAAIGIWWTMSSGGGESSTTSREPAPVTASKVLPAAAEPAPAEAAPVEAAPVEAAPVAAPAVATAATPASSATPTATASATRPAQPTSSRSPATTTGATASIPRDTPASSPSGSRGATPSPATADAGSSNVTSDSVWGTPTAPTSGFLRIVTDPEGATVYVNDAAKGKTPVTIELPYGAHQVRVVRAGYKTEVRDVNIRVRELTVPFNLKPEVVTGQVNVYGPDGFRVVVDGHDMGPMPVTVQVSEGVRQFKLVGSDGSTCNLPKEIKFKAVGRPETITLACP